MKEAAKFSRDNPCTKVHIWNCFRRAEGYPAQTVVGAKMHIGDNAPKYLTKQGYLRAFSAGGVDFYQLTAEGIKWLEAGIKRHVELRPHEAKLLLHPIPGTTSRPTTKVSGKPRVIVRRR